MNEKTLSTLSHIKNIPTYYLAVDLYLPATTYEQGIKEGIIKTPEEHKKNIENLKKGLDEKSLKTLNMILRQTEIFKNKPGYLPLNEAFSEDERIEYQKFCDFLSKPTIHHKTQELEYYNNNNYKLPMNFFASEVFLYKHGLQTLKTLKQFQNSHRIAIDAGAYICDSALVMREFFTNPIHCFEPTKENIELCKKTIELNNLKDITLVNKGISDTTTTYKIQKSINQGHADRLVEENSTNVSGQQIETISIDEYATDNNLEIGLIKTDIEGFEPKLLAGAVQTIKKYKPILLISIYHNYHDFYKIKPWIEDLDLGYKFSIFKGLATYPTEIYLIAEVY